LVFGGGKLNDCKSACVEFLTTTLRWFPLLLINPYIRTASRDLICCVQDVGIPQLWGGGLDYITES
jgi:hypothetical protein